MTDLEQRALLGDREAQEECTEKGIVLPCPFCGNVEPFVRHDPESGVVTIRCCIEIRKFETPMHNWALKLWNTRAAQPVGRCEDCLYQNGTVPGQPNIICFQMHADDYCSYYKPKEE